jgi:hypothetical protein
MNPLEELVRAAKNARDLIAVVECESCGGEGYTSHDCGEDCCCCEFPEDNVICEACGGKGWVGRRADDWEIVS